MSDKTDDDPLSRAKTEVATSFPTPEPSARAVTVVATQTFPGADSQAPHDASAEALQFEKRYERRAQLGEGGMGEVFLCHDARIGRDVAMKVARADQRSAAEPRARFLREVRVQGQLEHPSIVPVYDLGVGTDGATYFTMKRVKGLTLADILDRLRLQDPAMIGQYSQRKLLTAFQSVCLAIEFAHSHGVLHRDLKPSNIMLGNFGEVYVLDWGIAKILSEEEEEEGASSKVIAANPNLTTQVGSFVGTLGYLSPEQFAGEPLDRRSDVFSLGTILFEILTLVPLYEGSSLDVLKSMTAEPEAHCSVRQPSSDVAPELEAICVQATNRDRSIRQPSARDVHDAIGRFLDGDRDLERRRALAEMHLAAANEEIALLKTTARDGGGHRAKALAELGRALALDPTNQSAMSDIVGLLLAPPAETPTEVKNEIRASQLESIRIVGRTGGWAFCLGIVLLMPALIHAHTGYRALAFFVAVTGLSASAFSFSQVRSPSHRKSYITMVCCVFCYVAMSRLYGPFMLVPSVVMATSMIYAMHPLKRVQRASLVLMLAAIAIPYGLETFHLWPSSYAFVDGAMTTLPRALEFNETTTLGILAALTLFLIYAGSMVIQRARNALTRAEERLLIHAWQFRQLAPEGARTRMRSASWS